MRWMMVAGCMALAPASWAQTALPNYDPVAHCETLGTRNGARSESMISTCLRMEQEAYDALRPIWGDLPPAIRTHCDRRVSRRGNFTMLKTCVEMEREARQNNQQFQFRR